ncbi:type II secretion system protein [Candidatus Parcubacteria bacterium]|nr:type II secretion system protein [Candidatus Parcubacteria bacterium]
MKNYNKYKLITQKGGFTLVELLVSVGVIVVITSVFLINYNQYRKSANLNMATQEIVSNIRRVQNYALASKEDVSGNIPDGGWGIYFDITNNNKLIIFADMNDNGTYDGDGDGDGSDGDEDYELIILPKGIIVKNNWYPVGASMVANQNCDETSLVYKPPVPKVIVTGSTNCSATANTTPNFSNVEIQNTKGEIKIIKFNNFGLIDVE